MNHIVEISRDAVVGTVAAVSTHDLRLSYGDAQVLRGIDLVVAPGQTLALLGPSGCGKTTLLRLVAGLQAPTSGEVRLDGQIMAGPTVFLPPEKRNLGMVFQDYALFGASPTVAFCRIHLPLIAPSLLASMLLVFAVATRELVASIVMAPVGVRTVSTYIWRQFEQGSVGLGMAMAFVTILITTALPLIVLSLMGRRGSLL